MMCLEFIGTRAARSMGHGREVTARPVGRAASIRSRTRKVPFRASGAFLVLIPGWARQLITQTQGRQTQRTALQAGTCFLQGSQQISQKQHSWNTELSAPVWKALTRLHTPLGRLDKTATGFPFGGAELRVWLSRTGQRHPAERSGWAGTQERRAERRRRRQRPCHCPGCSPIAQRGQISVPRLCYRRVPRGHLWGRSKTQARWRYKRPQSVPYMQLFNEARRHYSKMTRGLS